MKMVHGTGSKLYLKDYYKELKRIGIKAHNKIYKKYG